ncbi:DMT family transporter [Raoultibacter massiliensis]|uniref:DMT family transporter n=1 Tax=Raoultibacter massiliensis TaxID=1852371 RepID=A0ABV1JBG2_9ACTN|nr:DMT family transporter [Raoultibacter massiliensis]
MSVAASGSGRRFVRGVICTLAGGTLWGFSGACAQFLLSGAYGFTPLAVTSARMLGAGLLFLVYMLAANRAGLKAMVTSRSTLARVAVFGAVGLFLNQITYTVVIDYTNAGTATVLQCTGIAFVMLFSCLAAKRLPKAKELGGLALAIGATYLIATHGDPSTLAVPLPGLLWGLANGLACAFYIIYPKRLLEQWGAVAVTGLGMLAGGIVATALAQPWTLSISLDGAGFAALAAIVVLGTFAAFTLYLQGVSDIGPVRASLLGAIEPVSATVFAWAWLGTQFPLADCIGFALMIVMVFLVTSSKGERNAAGGD